jgi:hypothetical protein
MYKVSRKQQYMLTLPRLMLFAAFFITSGIGTLQGGTLTALAAEATGKIQLADKTALRSFMDCTEGHRGPSFNSAVVVNDEEVICSDLTAFGGSVTIHGVVKGDVVVFGGNVVIDGTVNGNVTTYGSNLILQDSAQVDGDVHVCGGAWTGSSDSLLHRSVFSCTRSLGTLLTSISGTNMRFWSTLIWVILGMLLTSLLPEHVMLVQTTARNKMGRSFALGLLSVLLAPAILAVLVGLIISIPLAILVSVGLIAAWALGMVAIGWAVGDYIVRSVVPQYSSRLLQVTVGMAALALAGSLPSIGLWITIGSGLVGLGAVLLSRFGTRLYGPPRHPLPL